MVIGCRGGRQWGAREGGVTPLLESTPKGSNPPGRRIGCRAGIGHCG
jgi:hypothetical protein